jgi:prophage regulatory protein
MRAEPDSFLTLAQVGARVALSKSEIYKRIRHGTFPKQVPMGDGDEGFGRVSWLESEISAWIAARVKARDKGTENRREHALKALEQRQPGPGKKRRKAQAGFHPPSAARSG